MAFQFNKTIFKQERDSSSPKIPSKLPEC